MKKICLLLVAVSFPLLGLGCGGDDDEAAAGAKCDTLVSAFCSQYVGCKKISESMAVCVTELESQFGCNQAVKVSANYDGCLATVTGASCDKVRVGLPDICKGVILVR